MQLHLAKGRWLAALRRLPCTAIDLQVPKFCIVSTQSCPKPLHCHLWPCCVATCHVFAATRMSQTSCIATVRHAGAACAARHATAPLQAPTHAATSNPISGMWPDAIYRWGASAPRKQRPCRRALTAVQALIGAPFGASYLVNKDKELERVGSNPHDQFEAATSTDRVRSSLSLSFSVSPPHSPRPLSLSLSYPSLSLSLALTLSRALAHLSMCSCICGACSIGCSHPRYKRTAAACDVRRLHAEQPSADRERRQPGAKRSRRRGPQGGEARQRLARRD